MTRLVEQNLEHTFGHGWTASKYDRWPYYLAYFQSACKGNKAVDFVAVDPTGDALWLIELKDYRKNQGKPPRKAADLANDIAIKVRDSLAGLFAAAKYDAHHAHAADAQRSGSSQTASQSSTYAQHAHAAEAQRSLQAKRIRVVLHIEQPQPASKLFPRAYDRGDIQQKLKQRVLAIDPSPVVTEIGATPSLPWSIRSIP
jgi:hypothetical protein